MFSSSRKGGQRPPKLSARQAAEYVFAPPARRGEIARGAMSVQKGHGSSYFQIERGLARCFRDGVLNPRAVDSLRDHLRSCRNADKRWPVQERALEALEEGFSKIPLPNNFVLAPYTGSGLVLTPNPVVTISARPHAFVVDADSNAVHGLVYLRFSKRTALPPKAGPLAAHLLRTAANHAGYHVDAAYSFAFDTATAVWHCAPKRTKQLEQQFDNAMWTLGGTWRALDEK